MKKVLIMFFAVVGMMAISSEVSAQAPNGTATKGCPDGFNVSINGNLLTINCDFCYQVGLGYYPTYNCDAPYGDGPLQPGVCLTCFVVYDNISRNDEIIDIIKIPALNRAWVLISVISDNQEDPIVVNIGEEIDILELLALLQNQP
jgi:hypothetical protein